MTRRLMTRTILLMVGCLLATGGFAGSPAIAVQVPVVTLTMAGTTVAKDAIVQVDLVADLIPASGMSGFIISVSTTNPVARPVLFGSPAYGLTQEDLIGPSTLRLAVTDLAKIVEAGATDVTLGTVHFFGLTPGVTDIVVQVDRFDDDGGFPVTTSISTGLLTVTNSRDLDGDGLTEDCNGNGFSDFADIVCWFVMLIPSP